MSGDRLAGRVAIVTGGASGIGAAVVERLAVDGASVVIADIDQAAAMALAEELHGRDGDVEAIAVDVAEEASVASLIEATVNRYGRIDILDNNAALTDAAVLARDQDVASLEPEVWDRMFAVNLRGQFLMAKHVVPQLLRSGGGAIVNVSSGAAMKGDVTRTSYSASKAAIESLTRSIATQYGRQGVRANTIVPGLILTDAVRAGLPAEALARYTTTTLTPYVGEPRDVAGLVQFLVGDDSRYITGQTIVIDGGMGAHSARFSGLTSEAAVR